MLEERQEQYQRARQRRERRDKGVPRLTGRDIAILTWIGEQYAVRTDQLQILFGQSATQPTKEPGRVHVSTVSHCVARWCQLGLVECRQILTSPAWVWLTRAGLQMVGLPFQTRQPSAWELDHLYWCNFARLRLAERGEWKSERMLRHAMPLRKQSALLKVADAILTTNEGPIAIEIELSLKNKERLRATLLHALQFPSVWYFVPKQVRATLEETMLATLTDQQRQIVTVYDLDRLCVLSS